MTPDPRQLAILTVLRKRAGVSASDMAVACGLSKSAGRESVRAWERGEAIPHESRRILFLDYLLDTLGLRTDRSQLLAIWDILTLQWSWQPLSRSELTLLSQPQTATSARQATDVEPAGLVEPGVLPPGSYMPIVRNPYFVGRDAELRTLARMFGVGQTAMITAAAATGMGGIGKTQLAIEFVYRYGTSFPGGVFWLAAENPEALPSTIAASGEALSLHPEYDRLPLASQVRLVQEAWSGSAACLVVFDNCEDPDALARWRPRSSNARVLVTSRRSTWAAALNMHMLPLSTFRRDESVTLLHRYNPDLSTQDARCIAIAAELDDLPLALNLAGRHLARRRDAETPETYLASLRDNQTLQRALPAGSGILAAEHLRPLVRTFSLITARLFGSEPIHTIVRTLVARMAWLAHGETVPLELLRAISPLAEQAQQAAQILVDVGLLEQTDTVGTVRLHRLVAAYVLTVDWGEGGDMAQAEVEQALLTLVAPLNASEHPEQIRDFNIHLRAVTNRAQRRTDERAAALCHQLGLYLSEVDELSSARHYLERSLAILEQLHGPNHLALVTPLHDIGWIIDSQGDSRAALAHHERALDILRAIPNEDARTAESWNYVGTARHAMGDFEGARQAYSRALAIRERVCGTQHPSIAQSLNNLGLLYLFRAHYAEAYDFLKRAVQIRERENEHLQVKLSIAWSNLGYLLRSLARYDEAQIFLERAFAIRERVYGELNTYTAISLNHLGRLHHTRGAYEIARGYLERSLRIRRELVPHSGWSVNAISNLAILYFDMGDCEAARTLVDEARQLTARVWGPNHWHTARVLNHAGIIAAGEQNYPLARACFEQAFTTRRRILGNDHPDTANSLSHLAMLDLAEGDLEAASRRIVTALDIHVSRLGEQHPYTARSHMRRGQIAHAAGRTSDALVDLRAALNSYNIVFGATHPYTIACDNYVQTLF